MTDEINQNKNLIIYKNNNSNGVFSKLFTRVFSEYAFQTYSQRWSYFGHKTDPKFFFFQ